MRTLQVFFGVIVGTAVLGASVVVAEIRHESIQPVKLPVEIWDDSVSLPSIQFGTENVGGEEAQGTCQMSPHSAMPTLLMELPVPPINTPQRESGYTSAQAAIAPVSSLRSPAYGSDGYRRGGYGVPTTSTTTPSTPPEDGIIIIPDPDPDPDDPPPYVVPEPTTLAIIGLGIGGAVVVRRWRRI